MQTSPETPDSLCDSNHQNHHAQRREQQQHHQPTQQPYISPHAPANAAFTFRWPPGFAPPGTAAQHPAERQQQQQQQVRSAARKAYHATEAASRNTNHTFIDEETRARLIVLARVPGARFNDIVFPPGGVDEEQIIAAAQLVMLSKRAWEEGW